MIQAIAETIFDIMYLGFGISVGMIMLIKGKNHLVKKLGCMAALLGAGDSFHLVPRSYALWTTGLEANAAALGIGKFITSITNDHFLSGFVFYLARILSNQGKEKFDKNYVGIIIYENWSLSTSPKSVAYISPAAFVWDFA